MAERSRYFIRRAFGINELSEAIDSLFGTLSQAPAFERNCKNVNMKFPARRGLSIGAVPALVFSRACQEPFTCPYEDYKSDSSIIFEVYSLL